MLGNYDILLISPTIRIKTKKYYTDKKCRSKTVLTAGNSNKKE